MDDKLYVGDAWSYRIGTNTNVITYLSASEMTAQPAAKEKAEMRGLFEVFVVDPETEDVRLHVYVIASDEAKARLKAVQKGLRESLLIDTDDLDEFDFVVCRRGDVQAKRKVQEVKVVKE